MPLLNIAQRYAEERYQRTCLHAWSLFYMHSSLRWVASLHTLRHLMCIYVWCSKAFFLYFRLRRRSLVVPTTILIIIYILRVSASHYISSKQTKVYIHSISPDIIIWKCSFIYMCINKTLYIFQHLQHVRSGQVRKYVNTFILNQGKNTVYVCVLRRGLYTNSVRFSSRHNIKSKSQLD